MERIQDLCVATKQDAGHFLVSTAVLVGVGVGGIVGAIAGSYKGRLVAKRLG